MSGISPQLMQLVAGGAGKAGGPPQPSPGAQPGAPDAGAAPGGSPMSTPQPAQGDKQSALVNVSLAMDLLEQTLPALGSETEEGSAILSCLAGLSKKFGHTRAKSQELAPAEIMQMMSQLPQAGGMSPEAKAMGQHPIQPPGGMPAPMAA